MEGKARGEASTREGSEPDDSWNQVRQRVEEEIRLGAWEWASADPEDSWNEIGLKRDQPVNSAVRDRLEN